MDGLLIKLAAVTAVDEATGTWAAWRKGEDTFQLAVPGKPVAHLPMPDGVAPQGVIRQAVLDAVGSR
jgi:hypothetical protein